MEKPELKKSHRPETVECLCKEKVPEKDLLAHAKQCGHCITIFGTLPESIDNAIKYSKDGYTYKFLYYLFNHARGICKDKVKEVKKVQPIPVPPPVKYPFPIMCEKPSDPLSMEVPNEHSNEEQKADEDKVCSMLIDQSSVFCKLCSTRFLDLQEICYLQNCIHPFCRTDLKKLIFKQHQNHQKNIGSCLRKAVQNVQSACLT
eukprot:TRINITY_DN108_c1_g1_i1.p3 TRINITY_DN108_c1_g1~~TRINITY_DN108_c1_g1_i1.p3  ORF type:complete len:203 (+),score=20.77 TRINITY_DN108_c1_g1_i1:175-783(+)